MEPPMNWPDPEPGQARVLLLGSYHMDNPGLDAHNVDADDVLEPGRQAELRELVDRLAEWNPDRVAVERPNEREDEVNDVYRAYRDGEHAYDEPVEFESTAPGRGPATECRSEVVQVGFRLADRLDHDRVHAVDSRPAFDDDGPVPDWDIDADPEDLPYPGVDGEELVEADGDRLAADRLLAYFRYLNRAERLLPPHRGMYQYALDDWEADNYAGVAGLAYWYERNLRIVQNVWDAADPGDRVLLLFGAGHIPPLGHQFASAPMTCPVSPLPLLE
jgi:hypothetical protein